MTGACFMVFGPAMDVARARKEGVSPWQVLVRGNQLVSSRLSLRIKLAFWLTNGAYWGLALLLLVDPPVLPSRCGPVLVHALAVFVVATASSLFHGAVLSLAATNRNVNNAFVDQLIAALLGFDMLAANAYGLVLAWLLGFVRSLRLFAGPLLLLMLSAYVKRVGRIQLYAFLHGVWHLLSAAAMYRLLYTEVDGGLRVR